MCAASVTGRLARVDVLWDGSCAEVPATLSRSAQLPAITPWNRPRWPWRHLHAAASEFSWLLWRTFSAAFLRHRRRRRLSRCRSDLASVPVSWLVAILAKSRLATASALHWEDFAERRGIRCATNQVADGDLHCYHHLYFYDHLGVNPPIRYTYLPFMLQSFPSCETRFSVRHQSEHRLIVSDLAADRLGREPA